MVANKAVEKDRASEPDPLAIRRLRLWIRMLGVTRQIENRLREYLRVEHDTTLPRFDVMAMLHRRLDGLTMTELSRMLLISNGNATAVVNRLVQDGMVERILSDEDRRRVSVRLTEEGAAFFDQLASDHLQMIGGLLSELDDQDLDRMRDTFRRLRESLSNTTEGR